MPNFLAHYGLDESRPLSDQQIDWDASLESGTFDPNSRTAWLASSARMGDAFVGITYLKTNTHFMYPSFTYVNKHFTNGTGEKLTRKELAAVYKGHHISVDQGVRVLGGGQSALSARSGIQHKTVAMRAGVGAEPAFWIGWSILGTANPASPQEVRFVSGRNPGKFKDRRSSFSGELDPRDLPTRWRAWIMDDLITHLLLRKRRMSIGYGHHGKPRRIEIAGDIQVGWTSAATTLRDSKLNSIRALPKGERLAVNDASSKSGGFMWARDYLEVQHKGQKGYVRKARIKISSQKPA
jgi:hypothetical protein